MLRRICQKPKALVLATLLGLAGCGLEPSGGRPKPQGAATGAQDALPIDTGRTTLEPPKAKGTKGSGGKTGRVEQRFTASNGKASTYKTIIPADAGPDKAYGLTIHLHGDGGGDYQWLFEPNVAIGKKHDLIGIVVMAPNAAKRWYNDGEKNAVFLSELIEKELFAKYNVDPERVYFSGVSGGSQFLTGQFLPLFGGRYNSGAVLLCGGPASWLKSFDASESFVKRFKLAWYTHAGDFLADQVEAGIEFYKDKGFQVDAEILPGGKHCEFKEGIAGALAKKLPLVLH